MTQSSSSGATRRRGCSRSANSVSPRLILTNHPGLSTVSIVTPHLCSQSPSHCAEYQLCNHSRTCSAPDMNATVGEPRVDRRSAGGDGSHLALAVSGRQSLCRSGTTEHQHGRYRPSHLFPAAPRLNTSTPLRTSAMRGSSTWSSFHHSTPTKTKRSSASSLQRPRIHLPHWSLPRRSRAQCGRGGSTRAWSRTNTATSFWRAGLWTNLPMDTPGRTSADHQTR